MKMLLRVVAIIAAVLLLCSGEGVVARSLRRPSPPSHAAAAEEEVDAPLAPLQVRVKQGVLQGSTNDGVDRFTAIPYGAPPVGPLRFAKPQPAAPWTGVFQATSFGNVCVQPGNGGNVGSEDCLLLNVFSPSNRSPQIRLPVWVFIHGGGWTGGTGMNVPAAELAGAQNIITVAINYRLGPFGFWSLPGMSAENKDGSAGNWGLLDQILALQWVQQNIAAFGGDPSRVRIGGESAGALSMCALMATPLAKGLFQGAIIESGNCDNPSWFTSQQNAYAWGNTAAVIAGCNQTSHVEVLACLREIKAHDLHNSLTVEAMQQSRASLELEGELSSASAEAVAASAWYPLMWPVWPWTASIDGVFLTDTPARMMSAGVFNRVPTLSGTNQYEMMNLAEVVHACVSNTSFPFVWEDVDKILNHFFGNNPTVNAMIQQAYPVKNYKDGHQQLIELFRDFFFVCPMQRALLPMAAAGVPQYNYVFTYAGWNNASLAQHGAEMAYVWDFIGPLGALKDRLMVSVVQSAWGNFTRTGDPSAAAWPIFTPDNRLSLVLDFPLALVKDYQKTQCDVWAKVPAYTPPLPTQRKQQQQQQQEDAISVQ